MEEIFIKLDFAKENLTPSEFASYLYRNYTEYALGIAIFINQYNHAESIEALEAE